MTLLVKDEEEILLKNILFHKEMNVDGFIVTSHNSTDKTNEILEYLKSPQGGNIVKEIFYETDPQFKQEIWVDRMIRVAKETYNADWVINADADEFYYSKQLDLKKSILNSQETNANVLWIDSLVFFPDDRADFLNCPYFITRRFFDFEAKALGIYEDPKYSGFIENGLPFCRKVIHKTKGYKKIVLGNHFVHMKNKKEIQTIDINLYHFHIQNYKNYEKKIKRYLTSVKDLAPHIAIHMKYMISLYENGKLKQNYYTQYNDEIRDFLINNGTIIIDKSLAFFLKWKGIM